MYGTIANYARGNGINLEEIWMVWSLDETGRPVLCGKNDQRGFPNATQAYDWARRHTGLSRLLITGPGGRYDLLDPGDRYPRNIA